SIDYDNLGKMTAQQAFDILVKGADISTMPIGMMDEADLSLYINEETAAELGITIPSDLK
ncbi:MAG: sugar ABC transporter substrate-binding protein, partial [Ruthenibacterium sp.]